MKNIHVLPTENSSRLSIKDGVLILHRQQWRKDTQNIYITSDEEIKEGDYYLPFSKSIVKKTTKYGEIEKSKTSMDFSLDYLKKIILTTDQDLIKDGIQAIDDEFLEWFIKNSSCEKVEVKKTFMDTVTNEPIRNWSDYKIIIPKEEHKQELERGINIIHVGKPKQETLEEFIRKESKSGNESVGITKGAKWQSERMYSEEDIKLAFEKGHDSARLKGSYKSNGTFEEDFFKWFEQFKKK